MDKSDLFQSNQFFSVFYTYLVIMHQCKVYYMKSMFIHLLETQKIKNLHVYEYLFPPTVYTHIHVYTNSYTYTLTHIYIYLDTHKYKVPSISFQTFCTGI